MYYHPTYPSLYYASAFAPYAHPSYMYGYRPATPFFVPPARQPMYPMNRVASQGHEQGGVVLKDYGPAPLVIDIEKATEENNNYRTALWTGKYFQVTLMSINVGDDIGLEVHPTTDQFIRIEEGQGLVQMGATKNKLDFRQDAYEGYAIMVPAGKWHNVTNTGNKPLKVYVIYAPPHHPFGTVQETKPAAME